MEIQEQIDKLLRQMEEIRIRNSHNATVKSHDGTMIIDTIWENEIAKFTYRQLGKELARLTIEKDNIR
jgi:hypothetical protein